MRVVGLFISPSGPSTPSPADTVRAFCRSGGHQLAGLFTQGPGETEADVYGQMLLALKPPQGRPALVVVPDATHFAPDLETMSERLGELRSIGCDVRCLDGRAPDLVLNALDRLSLEGRAAGRLRRVRRAIMSKASRGEVLGRTPFGYTTGLDGLLLPIEKEASIVRNIFSWYSSTGGPGLRQIAHRLNDSGIRTRQGVVWTPLAVRNILRNATYIGTYNRYGVMIGGAHPAIVERSVFNIAQAILDRRKPGRRSTAATSLRRPALYYLSGLLKCSVCGAGMSGLTRRRSWKRRDGTQQVAEYHYYECVSGPSRRRSGAAVGHPAWRAEKLEAAILESLGDTQADAAAQSPEALVNGAAVEEPGQSRTSRPVALAEAEFMQALRDMGAGRTKADAVLQAVARLRSLRASERRGAAIAVEPHRTDGEGTKNDTPAATDQKRRVLQQLVERVIVHQDHVEVVRK